MGSADKGCGRPSRVRPDLSAEPVYLLLFERLASATRRSIRAAGGNARDHDHSADRLCAGGMGVFAIDGIGPDDGNASSDFLARRDHLWPSLPRARFLPIASRSKRHAGFVGRNLSPCGTPNDDRVAANRW